MGTKRRTFLVRWALTQNWVPNECGNAKKACCFDGSCFRILLVGYERYPYFIGGKYIYVKSLCVQWKIALRGKGAKLRQGHAARTALIPATYFTLEFRIVTTTSNVLRFSRFQGYLSVEHTSAQINKLHWGPLPFESWERRFKMCRGGPG